jgi:hypothetical protein
LIRDLLDLQEQQHELYSPASIARPESRTDYFNPPMHNQPTTEVADDAFLNTYPRLNQELRRINKELNNIKKFADPVTDALTRLAERNGCSPLIPHPTMESKLPLPSWVKRLSPEKPTDLPRKHSIPSQQTPPIVTLSRKNSLPSRLRKTVDVDDTPESDEETPFEEESKLHEITRQLWYSWPDRPTIETEEAECSTEPESITTTGSSSSQMRNSQLQPPVERRSFGSGLRKSWGSALSLAGIKYS